MTDTLSLQFSDLDFPADTFAPESAPAPRHTVFVYKKQGSITADCNTCEDGTESWGHDESSRKRVAAWVERHEAQL